MRMPIFLMTAGHGLEHPSAAFWLLPSRTERAAMPAFLVLALHLS
jgi:hypothetical protein